MFLFSITIISYVCYQHHFDPLAQEEWFWSWKYIVLVVFYPELSLYRKCWVYFSGNELGWIIGLDIVLTFCFAIFFYFLFTITQFVLLFIVGITLVALTYYRLIASLEFVGLMLSSKKYNDLILRTRIVEYCGEELLHGRKPIVFPNYHNIFATVLLAFSGIGSSVFYIWSCLCPIWDAIQWISTYLLCIP
ncbi:hypothetical protein [Candidatus Paracaedibacter symbiosus]|uniref:hypothetical protein n=1 Tax=Candidatus Paracaedibacter symbiosus TaxID=244582 RepID=UPI0012EBF35C|nr:hypothetical protein [Candidatus Paracaedibacter symbiosus]